MKTYSSLVNQRRCHGNDVTDVMVADVTLRIFTVDVTVEFKYMYDILCF